MGIEMAVLHDYKCLAHGYFEAWEPRCRHGCDGESVVKVFLQAVGTRSDSTKHADSTMRGLAQDYGMSDIKSVREGEAQPARFNQAPTNPYAVQWGNPSMISQYNTASIAGESTNGLQLGKETGKLGALRPSVVTRDHENLSIESNP
jgi:hypothetical protein